MNSTEQKKKVVAKSIHDSEICVHTQTPRKTWATHQAEIQKKHL